jgi:signal transduction histidine kinase/ActR/RegA family two-component response regulator
MTLEWGAAPSDSSPDGVEQAAWSAPVSSPAVFTPLQFRVRGDQWGGTGRAELSVPYVHVLLISLTLFSAVVLAGITLTRLLTRDLQRLEAFSRQLFGSGLKTERAPEGGSDEVAGLAKAINGMLDRLHDQHADLLHEREKLTQLTEALQAADRNKDNFLAMLGHELRNPLAPISAGAELLRRIPDTDPRVMRTSEVISRQVRHMTKIINDLLDVSRVTRGLITLDKTVIDVREIVSAAIEQVRPLIESRRHSLSLSVPDGSALVKADRARLVQVVSNLLTNSARYTAEGGQLLVDVSLKADEVWISVQDNGVGIAPDLMPQIFDLFTQGKRTVDRNEGGLGLGLALVKNLVALHGGSVNAASAGLSQGATFTVRLPRVQAPSPAPVADDEPPSPTSGHWRILVVDDNVDAAQTLAQLLTVEGHEVRVAHDGPMALSLAEQGATDVFILDIGLPGMDGMEVARRLRTMPAYRNAMLIALTGYGQSTDRQKSAEARFDHHLVKPADVLVLQNLLAGWAGPRMASPQAQP